MQENHLEKKSQSPLYMQLMTRLKNDIEAGVYPAGARIPSEQVLCETYGVSRVTVRKAMLDLVQEGLLIRRQGKGTFVADEKIRRDLSDITSFTDACAQRGHQAGSRFLSAQTETVNAEEAARLNVPEGSELIEITRVRLCDGQPVMLEINRYPTRYDFLAENAETVSQYACLKEHGIIPSSAIHDISLTHATPFVSKHLNTDVGEALLLLEELVMNQHGEPLHLSRQWIRGDRFTFRI